MSRIPLLVALLPLAVGIVVAETVGGLELGFFFWSMVAIGGAVGLTALVPETGSGRVKVGLRSAFLVFLTFLFISIGGLLTKLSDPLLRPDHYTYHSGPECIAVLRLTEAPRHTARSLRATAEVESVYDDSLRYTTCGRIQLYFKDDSTAEGLRYGDRIVARCNLALPPAADSNRTFDYRRYQRRHGILRQCYLAPWNYRVLDNRAVTLRSRAEDLRTAFRQRLQQRDLAEKQTGVAEALILGWRDDVDDETTALYRNAGIAHLLCVSGLHVGIIAALLSALLWPIGRRRWQRALRGGLVMSGVWAFALLSGLAPSTVRAAVMFSIFVVTDVFALRTSRYNTLAFAAFIMLVANPLQLFDASFQLSFAAVGGILAGGDAWRHRQPVNGRFSRQVVDFFVVTTSAQLATLPFILYYFHQFPTWFIVANMTVIPCAGVLLVSALGVLLFGGIPVVGVALEWILRTLLSATDALLRFVSSLPHPMLSVEHFTTAAAIATGAAVLAIFIAANLVTSKGCPECRE